MPRETPKMVVDPNDPWKWSKETLELAGPSCTCEAAPESHRHFKDPKYRYLDDGREVLFGGLVAGSIRRLSPSEEAEVIEQLATSDENRR
jgi:hypothetical protein